MSDKPKKKNRLLETLGSNSRWFIGLGIVAAIMLVLVLVSRPSTIVQQSSETELLLLEQLLAGGDVDATEHGHPVELGDFRPFGGLDAAMPYPLTPTVQTMLGFDADGLQALQPSFALAWDIFRVGVGADPCEMSVKAVETEIGFAFDVETRPRVGYSTIFDCSAGSQAPAGGAVEPLPTAELDAPTELEGDASDG